jgi:hypothetical protein
MTIDLQPSITNSTLYERDYLQWIEATAKQIRDRNFNLVDWDNLLEELDSLGKRDKREVASRLTLILMHLLKWIYQPEARSLYGNSWVNTIIIQRLDLRRVLADSPSLRNFLLSEFDSCYADARKAAAKETKLPIDTFPPEFPFTIEQALDDDFLPED